jgi:glyoxylase-like metal-dependent hydrolase (beta-lactamase superfamily II)
VKNEVKLLDDKEEVALGEIHLEVIHLPGHTPGGIALLMKQPQNNILFSGDSLFYHGIGRTDFLQASHEMLINSIKKRLLSLPPETIVYPGHGPSTTIGEEKKNNPFLI